MGTGGAPTTENWVTTGGAQRHEMTRVAPRTGTGFQTEIHFKPRVSPQARLCPGRLPTSRATREAPHKQNYDQGAHPQPELRPGSWLSLAGWLAELASWLAGWLWVWLAGLLRPRKAERSPERRREAQRSGAWIEQACHAPGCDAGGSPPAYL